MAEALRCAGAHRHTPVLLPRLPQGQQALAEAWGRRLVAAASSAQRLVLAESLLVLHRTARASRSEPAARQHVGERKTDSTLTLLCRVVLLICKLPLHSERLTASDLLQHLLGRAQLLGNFFRAQLLLNCVIFHLTADFWGKKERMVNSA